MIDKQLYLVPKEVGVKLCLPLSSSFLISAAHASAQQLFPERHEKDNMKMIFSTILDWKLQADGYPGEVSGLSKQLRCNETVGCLGGWVASCRDHLAMGQY